MADCEICGESLLQVETDWARPGRECPRCGEFRIDAVSSSGLRADVPWFGRDEGEQMVRLSGWITEQNVAGTVPTLDREIVNRIVSPSPSKVNRLRQF
jgi:hypothetical protein